MYTRSTKGREKIIKASKILKQEGLKSLLIKLFLFFVLTPVRYVFVFFSSGIILFKPKRFFIFQNKKLPYFYRRYNTTWKNERIIEVPIVFSYTQNFSARRILEFGAVLKHYSNVKWDILDKYERGNRIINKDVIDFKPVKKYDLIVSISTLEHVGFDEEVKDPLKIVRAIDNLRKNCLNPGGKGVITMPIGYNLEMDKLLFSRKLKFDKKIFLKRINKKNEWKEVSEKEARTKYGSPFNAANSIVVGIIKK